MRLKLLEIVLRLAGDVSANLITYCRKLKLLNKNKPIYKTYLAKYVNVNMYFVKYVFLKNNFAFLNTVVT